METATDVQEDTDSEFQEDWKMNSIFNPQKLSQDLTVFAKKKVIIAGSGAVGTYVAEFCAKLGVGHITVVDFDRFTLENAAKHSGIIRTPEDVDTSKSLTTARRITPLMIPGGTAAGVDANLTMLGPMALAGYDAVFLALDNYAAKLVINELVLCLPVELRPAVIMGGTSGELAQDCCLDMEELCLRCRMDESWLKDASVRTSCVGPRLIAAAEGDRTPTSGMASCKAALLMVEDFRKLSMGETGVLNRCTVWTPAMNEPVRITYPRRRKSCPDCAALRPPEQIIPLPGSVLTTTLGELEKQVEKKLKGKEFQILTHVLRYNGAAHSGILVSDRCAACGGPLPDLYCHEGRLEERSLRCPDCLARGKAPDIRLQRPNPPVVRAFARGEIPEAAGERTLFELGWPLGGYIEVLVRGEGIDLIGGEVQRFTFAMEDDMAPVTKDLCLL